MAENDFDIFTVSETWLGNSITDLEVEIPGYDVYRLDRHEKTGGGACAYVQESYKTKHLHDLSFISSAGFHQLWLQVQVGRCKSIVICTVYRPPNSDLNCFDAEFSDAVISALSLNHDVHVLGDLNCNLLNPQHHGSLAVMNFCSIFNLTQVIKQPTRITETSETLIDVFLGSNTSLIREAKVVPAPFSDHDLVFISLGLKKKPSKPVYVTTRSYKDFVPESFLVDLNCAPWSVIDCFEDVDDKLNAFNLLFNPLLDDHAPIKKIKLRSRPNPCVTDEIRSLIRTKDYWRKIARKSNDPLDWAAYKNFKREVKRELRLAERGHVENQIRNNPNNPRCVWKTIRKSVKKKSFSDSDDEVAKEFNEFFKSIGQNTVGK